MQIESKLDYGFIMNSNIDFSTTYHHRGTIVNIIYLHVPMGNYIKMGKSLRPSKSFLEIETLRWTSI
jgi:hypothetical protein